jgi:hypothetical protein
MRELGKPLAINGDGKSTPLSWGERRFLQCSGVTRREVVAAFQNGKLV